MTEMPQAMPQEDKPPVQGAIDELQGNVTSPEDQKVLEDWQKELDQARAETLPSDNPDLRVDSQGFISRKDDDEGDSGPYENGSRA